MRDVWKRESMMRRSWLAALVLASGILAGAATANAEVGYPTPTVQAVAADATWLAYAPAPAALGVVCLVDSGVDLNPDTEAALVGSDALYPGTDTGDEIAALDPPIEPGHHPDGHGTLMAMLIASPINGWGMIGLAPSSVRVYNMKALDHGSTTFTDEATAEGIERCVRLHEGTVPSLNTINISVAGESSPTPAVAAAVEREVTYARDVGISVVAAAGNNAGALEFPAAYGPVLAVGADNAGAAPGTLCSFSAYGEGLDLLAPGCDTVTGGIEGAFQDTGEPDLSQGSSQATAIVSATLTALRAYAPTLTMTQAEQCILSTTQDGELDAAAAFDACGLAATVQAGEQNEPASGAGDFSTAPSSTASSASGGSSTVSVNTPERANDPRGSVKLASFERLCATPSIARVVRSRRAWRIQARRKARGCLLQARYAATTRGRSRWRTLPGSGAIRLRIQVPAHASVEVRFRSPAGARAPSRWVSVRLASGHRGAARL